jgi:hypothetical protein
VKPVLEMGRYIPVYSKETSFRTWISYRPLSIPKGKKVKESHYTPWRRLGERRYSSYSFTTSVLDWGEWSASLPGCAFTPWGKYHRYPLDRRLGGPQSVYQYLLYPFYLFPLFWRYILVLLLGSIPVLYISISSAVWDNIYEVFKQNRVLKKKLDRWLLLLYGLLVFCFVFGRFQAQSQTAGWWPSQSLVVFLISTRWMLGQ